MPDTTNPAPPITREEAQAALQANARRMATNARKMAENAVAQRRPAAEVAALYTAAETLAGVFGTEG